MKNFIKKIVSNSEVMRIVTFVVAFVAGLFLSKLLMDFKISYLIIFIVAFLFLTLRMIYLFREVKKSQDRIKEIIKNYNDNIKKFNTGT